MYGSIPALLFVMFAMLSFCPALALPKKTGKAPRFVSVKPFVLAVGVPATIQIEGVNLADNKSKVFFGDPTRKKSSVMVNILSQRHGVKRRVAGRIETVSLFTGRLAATQTGPAFLFIGDKRQDAIPILVVDAHSEAQIKGLMGNIVDRNKDGITNGLDLDIDGDGIADPHMFPIVKACDDPDGDGIRGRLDAAPLVMNEYYDPKGNPAHNMRFLGYTGKGKLKARNVVATGGRGWTPLHYASFKGETKKVKAMCASKPSDVNAKDDVGWTPLHRAAFEGHIEAVKILLSNGADPCIKNGSGYTSLESAASRCRPAILHLLAASAVKRAASKENELRLWTSTLGTKLTARLIKIDGTAVKLKTKTGRIVNVPIAKLSSKDRAYLKEKH